MRTIKFRVWDKTNEIMWQPALKMESDRPQRLALDVPISDDIQPKPPYIWLQYTGLLDKNGKEIYEGDIVQSDWRGFQVGEVKYQMGEFILKNHSFAVTLPELFKNKWPVEVIGDIYQNPELLTAPIEEKI